MGKKIRKVGINIYLETAGTEVVPAQVVRLIEPSGANK